MSTEQLLLEMLSIDSMVWELMSYLSDVAITELRQAIKEIDAVFDRMVTYHDGLLIRQIPHYSRLEKILGKWRFALDPSPMGSGKTRVAVHYAKRNNLMLLCVGPKAAETVWYDEINRAGARFAAYISFEALSNRGSTVDHYFDITKSQDFHMNDITIITVTDQFKSLMKVGILLCIDEAHSLVGNLRGDICKEMAAAIIKYDDPTDVSRVLFLSGTAFLRKSTVTNFLSLMGLIDATKASLSDDNYKWGKGLVQLHASLVDYGLINEVKLIAGSHPKSNSPFEYSREDRSLIIRRTKDKCLSIVTSTFVSSMIPPTPENLIDIKNGLYRLNADNVGSYDDTVGKLYSMIIMGNNEGGKGAACINRHMATIETAILPTLARLAAETLDASPNNKVIILLNVVKNVSTLILMLMDRFPLELTGSIPSTRRASVVSLFQASSSGHRLIIGSGSAICTSLSLHDMDGRFPRFMFISPHFKLAQKFQSIGRITRLCQQSIATIRFVYSITGIDLLEIIDKLSRRERHVDADGDLDIRLQYPKEHMMFIEDM